MSRTKPNNKTVFDFDNVASVKAWTLLDKRDRTEAGKIIARVSPKNNWYLQIIFYPVKTPTEAQKRMEALDSLPMRTSRGGCFADAFCDFFLRQGVVARLGNGKGEVIMTDAHCEKWLAGADYEVLKVL